MGSEKATVLADGAGPPRFIPSTRFTLALLVFFAFIIQYSQRVNLPIAIVCMVNNTKPTEDTLKFNATSSSSINLTNNTNKRIPLFSNNSEVSSKSFGKKWISRREAIQLG